MKPTLSHRVSPAQWLRPLLSCLALAAAVPQRAHAETDLVVFDDTVENNWQNWSGASVDLSSTAVVHSGSQSIAVTAGGWVGFQLGHNSPAIFDTTGFATLTFWVNGGPTGGQPLKVYATVNSTTQVAVNLPPLAANTWQRISIPLVALGIANNPQVSALIIEDRSTTTPPIFYLDDIVITRGVSANQTPAAGGTVRLREGARSPGGTLTGAPAPGPALSGMGSVGTSPAPWTRERSNARRGTPGIAAR
jgi:hypothetical protein